MRPDLMERLLFFRAFLAHPRLVGAVLPTSRRAVRAMLDMADVPAAGQVVELGAGTGVYTREILARLGPQARLLAVEIDPALTARLAAEFGDPRVSVVCDSAENVASHLAGAPADIIVSGLPFTSLGATLRRTILQRARSVLAPDGVLLVLQYSPLIRGELRRLFGSVQGGICPYNVPPAVLFACRNPLPTQAAPP
ncbi:MAG: methyltransferase domain-containing protein [Frankiaceae bacterium]|jgi:phospholipid N-methyltransferase